MSTRLLSIAGLDFEISPKHESIQLCFPASYPPFLGGTLAGKLGARYRVVRPQKEFPSATKGTFLWATDLWRLRKIDQGIHLELRLLPDERWHANAVFNQTFSEGTLYAHHSEEKQTPVYVFNYPTDQVSFMHRLAYLSAGIVHGCGIALDGKAYIFCGRSGAGKTTIARLWREAGAMIMNDDRIVIIIKDGKPWAASTPWHGDEKEVNPACLPLSGIFHLNQAPDNHLTELDPTQGVARLMATSIAPFYSQELINLILATWSSALQEIPSYVFRFTPDQRAVELCLESRKHLV